MAILPVLDLMQGHVVRGIAGRRDEYRPIVSRLTASSRPRDVARAFAAHFGFDTFYVADLDGIGRGCPDVATVSALAADGFQLWVDAGIRRVEDAVRLGDAGATTLVVGLETIDGPDALRAICMRMGATRTVFSLDLKQGRPLGNLEPWRACDAAAIAQRAVDAGTIRLLVLDLADVGVGGGPGTVELCERLRHDHPHCELTAGGGVRDAVDVRCFYTAGVDHVLVASALHDGRITREETTAGNTNQPHWRSK